jgi:hypothetical protein
VQSANAREDQAIVQAVTKIAAPAFLSMQSSFDRFTRR